jgi:hypothetical protein
MGWTARVRFPPGARNFFFSTVSRPALGPPQPPEVAGHEADRLPPSSAKVKNGEATPPLLNMSSWHGA